MKFLELDNTASFICVPIQTYISVIGIIPINVQKKNTLFLTFKIAAAIFGIKKGIGINLEKMRILTGYLLTNKLNLSNNLFLYDLGDSPQLYFINKNINIAPIVADSKDAIKPRHSPKTRPDNIFKNGLIGMDKNTLNIYTQINISSERK